MKEHFRVTAPPASEPEVVALIEAVGPLPEALLALLRESNGAEYGVTDHGGDCLALWSCAEIPGYNADDALRANLPDCLAIGSDGGDDAVLLRREGLDPNEWPVLRVSLGSLDPEEFVEQAPNFRSWSQRRFQLTR